MTHQLKNLKQTVGQHDDFLDFIDLRPLPLGDYMVSN